MQLGAWVRAERKRRGWTIKVLAERMTATGLTTANEPYLTQLETGKINAERMGQDKLTALAAALGYSVDALLAAVSGSTDEPRSPTLAELRSMARGASTVAQQFLEDLEEDYPVVSDSTWHTLTQVYQALIAQDREQQATQRAQRAAQDTAAHDAPEGMPQISDSRRVGPEIRRRGRWDRATSG